MKQCRAYRCVGPTTILTLASLSLPAGAVDFAPGNDIQGQISATVTAGTMFRTEAPDTSVYGAVAGPRVGLPAGQLGANGGGSDLNFQKNKPVSTVLKGVASLELKRHEFGVFVRAMAWDDSELKSGNRAYGNIPNGFAQNAPLSDAGFAPEAKFSNAQFTDAYIFGQVNLGSDTALSARVGRQVLNWGVAQFGGGGINAINPNNLPAQQRPGALSEESKIPVGMVYANLAGTKQWGAEGFLQYEYRPTVLAGCGTYFVTANYLPTGCNYVSVLPTLNDPTALSTGVYPHRNPDVLPSDSGQYGLSLRFAVDSLHTDFRAYAMNYHSRTPNLRDTNANIAGALTTAAAYGTFNPATNSFTRLTDPNGGKYGLIYAENIHLLGMSFDTKVDPSFRAYGEVAHRPNQPLNLNASDLLAAFLQRAATSALNLAKNTNAIAPGGTFDAYDRFAVTTASLGASKAFQDVWWAQRVAVAGEFGWSHVAGLPDPGVLRYGRSDMYGVAALNGQVCSDKTVAQKTCAHDGFVTSTASGVRVRLSAIYPGAFFGATLTPSLTIAQDFSGYSYDGSFQKDRSTMIMGLRSEWAKQYYAEIQYTRYGGGAYNTLVDRDNVTLVVGARF